MLLGSDLLDRELGGLMGEEVGSLLIQGVEKEG